MIRCDTIIPYSIFNVCVDYSADEMKSVSEGGGDDKNDAASTRPLKSLSVNVQPHLKTSTVAKKRNRVDKF